MPEDISFAKNIYWVFAIVLKDSFNFNAEFIMKKLNMLGIGTRPFFYPMHLQPVFNKMGWYLDEKYPIAEKIAEKGFYLPSGLGLKLEEQLIVVDKLSEILENNK